MNYDHTCKLCNIKFTTKTTTSKFCSVKCKIDYSRINSIRRCICIQCNIPFIGNTKETQYCSKVCHRNYAISKRPTLICKQCSKSFKKLRHLAPTTLFCSRKCASNYAKDTGCRKQGIKLINKLCNHCNTEFGVHPYRESTASYCSMKCWKDARTTTSECKLCGISYTEQTNVFNGALSVQQKCRSCRELNTISAFELSVREALRSNNIEFTINGKIQKFDKGCIYPDIICSNLIIECNGDFFHCNPEKYVAEFINPKTGMSAKETWERDERKYSLYKERGYNVLVIWEEKWRDDVSYRESIIQQIYNETNNIQKNQITK